MLANPYSAMLRFNVGHVLSKSVGFISEIRFSAQQVDVSSDLKLVRLLGDACLTRTPPGILFEGELDVLAVFENISPDITFSNASII